MFAKLWTIKFFFCAVLTTHINFFLLIFFADVYLHLALCFLWFIFVYLMCFFFVRLFFSYLVLFFLHSASQLILFKKIVLYLLVFFIEFLQFFHIFIYFFVATDPREPNYQYEEGNSFGDIYASFASNKR